MNALLLASASNDWSSVAILACFLTFVLVLVSLTRQRPSK
jgi:hypothetical protein